MLYGLLRTAVSTGIDSELICSFAAPITVGSNSPTFSSDTLSLKRPTGRQPAQRWEIETRISPNVDPSELFVHSVIAGNSEMIYLRMPQIYGRKPITGSPSVTLSATALVDATTVVVTGLGAQLFSKGEFITFTGDAKVYMVKGHVGNNVSIYPPLRSQKAAGTVVTFGGAVVMRALYDNSVRSGISFSDGILMDMGTVRFVEKL